MEDYVSSSCSYWKVVSVKKDGKKLIRKVYFRLCYDRANIRCEIPYNKTNQCYWFLGEIKVVNQFLKIISVK
jgi:hypothetical protein